MKGFRRDDLLFSLCGLNCGLCPMQLDGYCPGCGGGAGNQTCAIAACSLTHGGVSYCFQCAEFPCGRYAEDAAYDLFITHQHQRDDMRRAQEIGLAAYQAEQREKAAILRVLLQDFNDGRRKSFFCVAVNLLPLQELKDAMREIQTHREAPIRERAVFAVSRLRQVADRYGLILKLRKKPGKKP